MLLSVRIYTHPRGDEMDEEGGELIRALSPSRKQSAERLNIHEFEIAE